MPLPSSGPLSINQIRSEEIAGGFNSTGSLRQLSANASFNSPDSISEFYGYSSTVITSGLVFNVDASRPVSYPGTGTTWFDLSGNGNNATLGGTTSFSTTNGGLFTLGSNGTIRFPNSTAGSNTGSFSWGVWLKPVQVGGTSIFLARGQDFSGDGWSIAGVQTSTGFNASIVTMTPSPAQFNASVAISLSTSNWYYYGGVYTHGVSNSSARAYANGVGGTTLTTGTTLRDSPTGWTNSLNATNNNMIYGAIHLYNRALSAAEVLQNFNTTKRRYGY
jgi:hypothetical protein